jgi:parallel beta-helix repeat protein
MVPVRNRISGHGRLVAKLTIFSLLVLSHSFSPVAWTATYYVSGAPGCSNDPALGSEANPWCTFSYGIGRLRGGDILNVKSGTYQEAGIYISSNLSGTPGQVTIVRAVPGDSVTIRGGGINTGRIKITGCSYLTFDGFVVENFNQGIYVEASSNITVSGCTVRDVGQDGVHVLANSRYVTIQNCHVFDTGKWIYNGEGIYVGTGSTGPVDNSAYITIRSNVVHDVGTTYGGEAIELKPGTHDCVVENNTVYNVQSGSNVGAIEVNEGVLGVQRWDANPNHIVRNNRLYHLQTAIRAGTGCLVYNNLIYGVTNGNYGILADNAAGDAHVRRIYHNTIDTPAANAVRVAKGTTDIRNNLGPSLSNNLPVLPSYFVNAAFRNYRLTSDGAPVDAGLDLGGVVTVDREGIRRPAGDFPDLGAYEYSSERPLPPVNLRIVTP